MRWGRSPPARIRSPARGSPHSSSSRARSRMNPFPRAIAGLLVQAALLVLAGYLAFSESALPGATPVARAGLAAAIVVLGLMVAEVSRLRQHIGALVSALRAAAGAAPGVVRDDRAAVDVLVRALSSDDPDVRVKAHRNLVRITGQQMTMDPARWEAWWKDARESFVGKDVGKPS